MTIIVLGVLQYVYRHYTTLHSSQVENLFGRTMDFSYPIEPGLYVIPRNYEWYSLITMKKILIYSSPRKRYKKRTFLRSTDIILKLKTPIHPLINFLPRNLKKGYSC